MFKRNKPFTEEEIIAVAKLHIINWLVPLVLALLAYHSYQVSYFIYIFRINYLCFAFLSFYTVIRILRTKMFCTNKRIFLRSGVLFTQSKEMRLDKIESIEVKQSIFGHIFRYGSVYFIGSTTTIKFKFISRPWDLKEYIESSR